MKDYQNRQGRNLPDGMGAVGNKMKFTEALGCRMWMDEDALTVDGEPTGGQFHLSYRGYKTDPLEWDCSASDVETALNTLFTDNDLEIEVECTGGPLPDTPITITGDEFSPTKLKMLFGKLTGGDYLSDGGGATGIYCAVLDSAANPTFDVVEADAIGLHFARGTRAMVLKVGEKWLLADCGGTWYAVPHDLANFPTNGLEIEFTGGGPAGVHKAENDSDDDPESDWTEARDLLAHPYNGTWYVYPKGCA